MKCLKALSVNDQSYPKIQSIPGLMSDVGPKIPANDAMPGWVVLFVKLLGVNPQDFLEGPTIRIPFRP